MRLIASRKATVLTIHFHTFAANQQPSLVVEIQHIAPGEVAQTTDLSDEMRILTSFIESGHKVGIRCTPVISELHIPIIRNRPIVNPPQPTVKFVFEFMPICREAIDDSLQSPI